MLKKNMSLGNKFYLILILNLFFFDYLVADDKITASKPKKTKQGRGKHTKYSATASNKAKKKYRGQGRK